MIKNFKEGAWPLCVGRFSKETHKMTDFVIINNEEESEAFVKADINKELVITFGAIGIKNKPEEFNVTFSEEHVKSMMNHVMAVTIDPELSVIKIVENDLERIKNFNQDRLNRIYSIDIIPFIESNEDRYRLSVVTTVRPNGVEALAKLMMGDTDPMTETLTFRSSKSEELDYQLCWDPLVKIKKEGDVKITSEEDAIKAANNILNSSK